MWITSLLLNLQVAKIPLCSALADGSEILHQFEYPTNCCISKFHLGIRYISHLLGILRIPYPTKKLFLSKECSWICENISIVPVLGRLFYINIHPGSTLELITLELMGSPNEISFPTTKNGYALNKDPTMIAGYNNNAKQDESLKIKDTNHNSWWLALKRKITFIYIKYIFYIYIYIYSFGGAKVQHFHFDGFAMKPLDLRRCWRSCTWFQAERFFVQQQNWFPCLFFQGTPKV